MPGPRREVLASDVGRLGTVVSTPTALRRSGRGGPLLEEIAGIVSDRTGSARTDAGDDGADRFRKPSAWSRSRQGVAVPGPRRPRRSRPGCSPRSSARPVLRFDPRACSSGTPCVPDGLDDVVTSHRRRADALAGALRPVSSMSTSPSSPWHRLRARAVRPRVPTAREWRAASRRIGLGAGPARLLERGGIRLYSRGARRAGAVRRDGASPGAHPARPRPGVRPRRDVDAGAGRRRRRGRRGVGRTDRAEQLAEAAAGRRAGADPGSCALCSAPAVRRGAPARPLRPLCGPASSLAAATSPSTPATTN